LYFIFLPFQGRNKGGVFTFFSPLSGGESKRGFPLECSHCERFFVAFASEAICRCEVHFGALTSEAIHRCEVRFGALASEAICHGESFFVAFASEAIFLFDFRPSQGRTKEGFPLKRRYTGVFFVVLTSEAIFLIHNHRRAIC